MSTSEANDFCDGIGWETADWPGPWGCNVIMREVVDGVSTSHRCAASYDHVDYRDEPHVCALGHSWPVWRPRRRWWDRLLRKCVPELPRRREASFWTDLSRHLEEPEPKFRRSYIEETLRIQTSGEQANEGHE